VRDYTLQIWEKFGEEILNFIRKRVSSQEDAEDLRQEVFLRIHNKIDTLKNKERLIPWFYQITRNVIYDYYRRKQPQGSLPDLPYLFTDKFDEEPAQNITRSLIEFVACLPEKYREAITLTEIEGLKQSALAEKAGITLSNAKSRVQRGRALLKKALLDCCHLEFDPQGRLYNYIPRQICCKTC